MIRLDSYESPQLTLLFFDLSSRYPGLAPDTLVMPRCLERAERELQERQIAMRRGVPHFIDLAFDRGAILPTPTRMGADPKLKGKGVTIAFVDSGFAPHPDLILPKNRVVASYNAVTDIEIPSLEAYYSEGPPASAWHGTMTAAVAAGTGHLSDGYYRGIASEAKLVLVKAMTPSGRVQTPQVRRALKWLLLNREKYGIDVVNLSLGVDEQTRSMRHPVVDLVERLVRAGVTVVAASGNNPTRPLVPPGAAPSAITVGGYNDNNSLEWADREIWHSSYGRAPGGGQKPELLGPAIWVAAPILLKTQVKIEAETLFYLAGQSDRQLLKLIPSVASETAIEAQLMTSRTGLEARAHILERMRSEKLINAAYKHVDGTSFSAPIVSSLVAQIIESEPGITPDKIRRRLFKGARRIAGVGKEVQGYGVVGAAQ